MIMCMNKIRISSCNGEGYLPLSIHEGWQVAYLTTCEKHQLDDLENMEVHLRTDELFILLRGGAVLLEADYESKQPIFHALNMKPFLMYDVPQGVWHNIAMAPDALLLIVEKDGTHLNDVAYRDFSEEDRQVVNGMIELTIRKGDVS